MSRSEVRAQVAAGITNRAPTRNSKDATRVYEAWCRANDQPVLPDATVAEQQLLRFLHSSHRERAWSWGTCSNYALGIAQHYGRHSRPDPRGPRVKAWLLALKRRQAGHRAASRTDALRDDQILSAVAAPSTNPNEYRVTRLRGIIAVAEVLGVDPTVYGTDLQQMPRAAFRPGTEDIVVRDTTGHRHVLDRARRPAFFAALTAALAQAGDTAFPLFDADDARDKPLTVKDTRRLRAAWDRAAPRGAASVQAKAASWRAAWTASNAEDRVWWLKCVDSDFEPRTQDLAYLLVGLQTAFRHQTMKQLTPGHVETTPTGYVLEIGPHEHKGGLQSAAQGGRRRPLTKFVDHLEKEPRLCPDHCPACALRRQLEVRRRRGGGMTDPLWVASNGGPLERDVANDRLRQLVGGELVTDDGTPQTIGTRSLRVTAATMARRLGMTPAQIAECVTDHEDVATAEVYIRRIDPFSFQLALTIG